MHKRSGLRRTWVFVGCMVAGVMGLPSTVGAQTISQAKVIQATLAGTSILGLTLPATTTILADTGPLPAGMTGALQASSVAGSVPSLLSGDSLHATVIGLSDRAASEASLGSLGLSVGGNTVSADFLLARARAVAGSGGSGDAEIDGLLINGAGIPVSGAPNQTVPIVGGSLILNEQRTGPNGAVVNALHLIITGVADVVVASASAAIP